MFTSGNAFLRKKAGSVFCNMGGTLLASQYGAAPLNGESFWPLLSCYSIEIA